MEFQDHTMPGTKDIIENYRNNITQGSRNTILILLCTNYIDSHHVWHDYIYKTQMNRIYSQLQKLEVAFVARFLGI